MSKKNGAVVDLEEFAKLSRYWDFSLMSSECLFFLDPQTRTSDEMAATMSNIGVRGCAFDSFKGKGVYLTGRGCLQMYLGCALVV